MPSPKRRLHPKFAADSPRYQARKAKQDAMMTIKIAKSREGRRAAREARRDADT